MSGVQRFVYNREVSSGKNKINFNWSRERREWSRKIVEWKKKENEQIIIREGRF